MVKQVTKVTRTVTEDEGIDTEPEQVSGSTIAERIVYLMGGVLAILLSLRFLFSLLGANRDNVIADFVYSITTPFVAPFFGLFGYTAEYGVSRFEFETLIAIIAYLGLTTLIARLVTIDRPTREEN